MAAPPNGVRNRAAVVAVAAGAVVAAGHAAIQGGPASASDPTEIALAGNPSDADVDAPQIANVASAVDTSDSQQVSKAPQVLNVATPVDVSQFDHLLAKGQKYAQERAAEEAAKLRPLYAKVTEGSYTSGFGARWGTQHLGIDIANSIGTPIRAVADGTVIDSGPASGFGMWVRLLHADGTVTVYGHIDSATVQVGQRVMAGDEIAKMGNRGFSTGPHLHFEVWQNGKDKVDPVPWLASRGISVGTDRH
ncbi:MAG: M23 family metallopeptidase [Aldersonia sp.]|nr:M23 family metallopeptidase [Aldersonia sp.]